MCVLTGCDTPPAQTDVQPGRHARCVSSMIMYTHTRLVYSNKHTLCCQKSDASTESYTYSNRRHCHHQKITQSHTHAPPTQPVSHSLQRHEAQLATPPAHHT